MADIDALVASVLGRPPTNTCWAIDLDGDAAQFVEALELAEDQQAGAVFRKGASAILTDRFGIELANPGNVARHLKRECKCRPKNLPI